MSDFLLSRGYISSENDYSLFTKSFGASLVVVAIYVDNIILARDDLVELNSLKAFFDAKFKIKDLGVCPLFSRVGDYFAPKGYLMSKHKYTFDLLAEFHCDYFTPVSTPLDSNVKLVIDMGEPLSDTSKYNKLVGKHNFLQHTRTSISFYVQHLSQFLQSPHVPHLLAARHVLRCLLNAPAQGILLFASSDLSLQAFLGFHWVACAISRRSVTSFYITLGASPISSKSKRQPIVSLSEYRALQMVVVEISWLV